MDLGKLGVWYFTTPTHTKSAREILGPEALLCVEQKVILETDPDRARQLAHLDAGASHVCVQPVSPDGAFGEPDMNVLEQLIGAI